MLTLLSTTLRSAQLDSQVLGVAYELYLQAPQSAHPLINLRQVSEQTGTSLLECRNIIVSANKAGRFPNCALDY